jgi:hypothetical protein
MKGSRFLRNVRKFHGNKRRHIPKIRTFRYFISFKMYVYFLRGHLFLPFSSLHEQRLSWLSAKAGIIGREMICCWFHPSHNTVRYQRRISPLESESTCTSSPILKDNGVNSAMIVPTSLLLIYTRLQVTKVMKIKILKREISLTDFNWARMPHKRYTEPFYL